MQVFFCFFLVFFVSSGDSSRRFVFFCDSVFVFVFFCFFDFFLLKSTFPVLHGVIKQGATMGFTIIDVRK
jgi:hypothetical protein